MANPYYPPRPNHFGGPAMRYDGSQQPNEYQNPYSRQHSDPYQQQQMQQHSYPGGPYQQSNQYGMQGGAGGYYDPYASAGHNPEMFRVSLSDNAPLAPPNAGFAGRADFNSPQGYPQRPDSPADGVYPDRAPKWEKLSPAQVKIAKTFPKDLDDEPKSMLQSWKALARRWRDFVKWKYWYYYLLMIIAVALTVLMTIFHRQIIDWLTPVSKKIKSVSWGWVIPVIIFVVISFPPLFGHEILAILCGVVYGLWVGFAIVSLGTLLGEIANFYAFKTFLQKHAERYERKNISYGCMAHIVREGGFMVILLARLSAIPGHFTTAVFATVGMSIWIFTIAAILSLPKQLSIVYLGVAIEQSGSGAETNTSKIVKYVVLIISLIITCWAAHYLYGKMEKARPHVQQTLRAKRYTLLSEARKTEVALANTTDYDRPPTASSAEHDDAGRPLRSDSQRFAGSQPQQPQPRWNRWSAQQHPQEEAEMQQLPYQNNAASSSGLMPGMAPIGRLDSRMSEMTAEGTQAPIRPLGSASNISLANDFGGTLPASRNGTQGSQRPDVGSLPQLRVDTHAPADEAQPLRQSPQGSSPTEHLSPQNARGPRYQYESHVGSIYSLQQSSAEEGPSPTAINPYDRYRQMGADPETSSLPSYTTAAPPGSHNAAGQFSHPQAQQYQQSQQGEQLARQAAQQSQQSYQPQQQQIQQQAATAPGQGHHYGQQQPYGGPPAEAQAWQSPPLAMQHDLGQRRWDEPVSPQAF